MKKSFIAFSILFLFILNMFVSFTTYEDPTIKKIYEEKPNSFNKLTFSVVYSGKIIKNKINEDFSWEVLANGV